MTKEEKIYNEIGLSLEGAQQGQMFGKPCFKINEKTFVCFFEKSMVFKLSGNFLSIALSLEGSQLFDPSGNRRPMKEWVQIPSAHRDKWAKYAKAAMDYVKLSTQ
jgi:hypothetical protein